MEQANCRASDLQSSELQSDRLTNRAVHAVSFAKRAKKSGKVLAVQPGSAIDMPGDARRMDDIAWIAGQGYEKKILVAHDICTKNRLERYGGHGYAYILGQIVPRMRARGFNEEVIDNILVNNPAIALTFAAPEEER